MPRIASELTALDVRRLSHPGGKRRNILAPVGGVPGLCLQITPRGARSWILRVVVGEVRRDVGLGSYPGVTLAQARDKARAARASIEAGVDPVAERKAAKAALVAAQRAGAVTFAQAIEGTLAARLDGYRNEKHRAQWRATLDFYVTPIIGGLRVRDVAVTDVLRVLTQEVRNKAGEAVGTLWQARPETASRLRGRIEATLAWATVRGHRSGDNPARWAGNLRELLPAQSATVTHHPALALADAPRWFAALRAREGVGARAVEFAALTAARSGEVRGAAWAEIDLEAAIWTVPPGRMKTGREHRAVLSDAAVAVLQALPRNVGSELVFPAPRGGRLSDMTLTAAMKRLHEADVAAGGPGFTDRQSGRPAVVHGLRSVFRDWTSEQTTYPGELAEIALAHRVGSAVEAAYRRGDQIEKRRRLMGDWADFLAGEARGNVVSIGHG
jgi:integrase